MSRDTPEFIVITFAIVMISGMAVLYVTSHAIGQAMLAPHFVKVPNIKTSIFTGIARKKLMFL
jgi:hypothetical protein